MLEKILTLAVPAAFVAMTSLVAVMLAIIVKMEKDPERIKKAIKILTMCITVSAVMGIVGLITNFIFVEVLQELVPSLYSREIVLHNIQTYGIVFVSIGIIGMAYLITNTILEIVDKEEKQTSGSEGDYDREEPIAHISY